LKLDGLGEPSQTRGKRSRSVRGKMTGDANMR
jgi:hypothetical protein